MESAFVTVRTAVPGDLDALWAICLQVKEKLAADHIPIWNNGYPTRENFAEDIASGRLLAAEQAGVILGSLYYDSDFAGEYYYDLPAAEADAAAAALLAKCGAVPGHSVSAHRLMILPAARRTGAAAALLAEFERRTAGQWIVFFASPANPPACRLYAKFGYHDLGACMFSFGLMHYLYKSPEEHLR